ncbi:relaxase/mobilization nuclease domain-containing protein [Streptomyces iconiensis]|uniref:Mobilization protein n=1 Tax=Streptomyces iconiensis TaxID=1384038 RepID=A0ABT7A4Q4_9ACTN|nr:relaxase/mobilization nuclease domain-containing protein [Streptomyces iconiensis]MDJ1136261.1 mobilization protein [Streptomyces iconiensis]
MVPDISLGGRTYGLLAYLYGPGRRDEHLDPHLVASWQPELAPDPGRDPAATLKQLQERLDLPVEAVPEHRRPKQHVWHCPVRTDPGDRHLSDAEWAEVARRVVAATGIAEEGDERACRWIAVRHAEDHIHIVATLKRADGRSPRRHDDYNRAQAECRQIEKDFGLRRLNPGDRTAAKRPTSAERAKAERAGRTVTARELLRDHVRQAMAGAADEAEFFDRLTEAGVRLDRRLAPSGDVLGYRVALPGDRNRAGQPVWFPGSRLGHDLSLPKIRRRLGSPEDADVPPADDRPRQCEGPARARRDVTGIVERTTTAYADDGDEAEAAAQLSGLGEVLDAVAQTSPASTRQQVTAAARAFERATRFHTRAERADDRAVRFAARGIIQAGNALGRGEDGGATAMLLSTLVLATIAAARWHTARRHHQQAAAARQAADQLRAAYRTAATSPLRAMRAQGRRLPERVRTRHTGTVEAALPGRTGSLRREDGWDALVATLDQAENAGHNPEALLQQAVAWRELNTADSVTDVLVWRLRRIGRLPADPSQPRADTRTTEQQPQPARTHTATPTTQNPAAPEHRRRR